MTDAYIVGAVRSAGGKKNGRLSKIHPIDLGAEVVDALVAKTGVAVAEIDDLIFGCVSQVGALPYQSTPRRRRRLRRLRGIERCRAHPRSGLGGVSVAKWMGACLGS